MRNSYAHLLKLAETEALAVRRSDSHIAGIIEEIDLLVPEGEILAGDNEAISEEFHAHAAETQLALENLEQPPAAPFPLVANTEEIERLRGILYDQFSEGHHEKVVALSGLIAIQIEKEEDVGGELQLAAGEVARHRVKEGR